MPAKEMAGQKGKVADRRRERCGGLLGGGEPYGCGGEAVAQVWRSGMGDDDRWQQTNGKETPFLLKRMGGTARVGACWHGCGERETS